MGPDFAIVDEKGSEAYKPYAHVAERAVGYCYADYISDLRVLGVPTREGKGPTLSVDSSVAISVHTKEKDACITFVNGLLLYIHRAY